MRERIGGTVVGERLRTLDERRVPPERGASQPEKGCESIGDGSEGEEGKEGCAPPGNIVIIVLQVDSFKEPVQDEVRMRLTSVEEKRKRRTHLHAPGEHGCRSPFEGS